MVQSADVIVYLFIIELGNKSLKSGYFHYLKLTLGKPRPSFNRRMVSERMVENTY